MLAASSWPRGVPLFLECGLARELGLACGLDVGLVVGDRLRRLVLQSGELRLQRGEVLRLLVEGGLRGDRRLTGGGGLLLGELLQAVALRHGQPAPGQLRFCAVLRALTASAYALVGLDEAVHGAELGQQIVGARGGPGEEEVEGCVVAARAVLLCGEAAEFARRLALARADSASACVCSELALSIAVS